MLDLCRKETRIAQFSTKGQLTAWHNYMPRVLTPALQWVKSMHRFLTYSTNSNASAETSPWPCSTSRVENTASYRSFLHKNVPEKIVKAKIPQKTPENRPKIDINRINMENHAGFM